LLPMQSSKGNSGCRFLVALPEAAPQPEGMAYLGSMGSGCMAAVADGSRGGGYLTAAVEPGGGSSAGGRKRVVKGGVMPHAQHPRSNTQAIAASRAAPWVQF
jgi:hypothetical protein